jgi:integrase
MVADTETVVRTGKLNVKRVESILAGKVAGRYFGDGAGLWLVVTRRDERGKALAASWVYRFMLFGKSREVGLGSAWDVGLADVREAARLARVRVRTKAIDVLEEKRADVKAKRAAAQIEQARAMTFRECAAKFIRGRESEWKNAKSRAAWVATLETANKQMGDVPVADVDTAMVMRVLEPMWLTTTETASRLRGRIEMVLNWASTSGFRPEGLNPARWSGHLENLLPRKSKIAAVEHHAALPYRQIGAFVAELRQQGGVAARALEFAILTWARTGTVLRAEWSEFQDAERDRLWHAPAAHMKDNRAHRYPLCARSLEILAEMREIAERRPSKFVFQGLKDEKPLSDMSMLMLLRRMGHPELTVHGFRSTADDWAADLTHYPQELRKIALAHIMPDRVEAAYRRGDGLAKRRHMADDWCRFCSSPFVEHVDNVVSISAA